MNLEGARVGEGIGLQVRRKKKRLALPWLPGLGSRLGRLGRLRGLDLRKAGKADRR